MLMVGPRGILITHAAFARETQQARNIVDAAAATTKTLSRFIWSTLSDTKKFSKGTITENLHFDGKASINYYVKEKYPDLAAK